MFCLPGWKKFFSFVLKRTEKVQPTCKNDFLNLAVKFERWFAEFVWPVSLHFGVHHLDNHEKLQLELPNLIENFSFLLRSCRSMSIFDNLSNCCIQWNPVLVVTCDQTNINTVFSWIPLCWGPTWREISFCLVSVSYFQWCKMKWVEIEEDKQIDQHVQALWSCFGTCICISKYQLRYVGFASYSKCQTRLKKEGLKNMKLWNIDLYLIFSCAALLRWSEVEEHVLTVLVLVSLNNVDNQEIDSGFVPYSRCQTR